MSGPIGAESSRESRLGERTVDDLSSLATELARAMRGRYSPDCDDAARRRLLDRAFLAFHVELERCGPIDLCIESSGFHSNDLCDRVPAKHLEDLLEALLQHDVRRVRFTPGLSRNAFHAFVDYLDPHRGNGRRGGGDAAAGPPGCGSGITINDDVERDANGARPRALGHPTAREDEPLH
jgi:hypothetical protein